MGLILMILGVAGLLGSVFQWGYFGGLELGAGIVVSIVLIVVGVWMYRGGRL